MKIKYETSSTCAKYIEIDMEDRIINDVKFIGGCTGNTSAISTLVKGMTAEQVIEKLKGLDCKGKGTSCPDQLAKALDQALQNI